MVRGTNFDEFQPRELDKFRTNIEDNTLLFRKQDEEEQD